MFIVIVGIITMIISVMVKPEDIKAMELIMKIKNLYIGMILIGYIFNKIKL